MEIKDEDVKSPGKLSSAARWIVFVIGGLFFLIIAVAAIYRKMGG